MATKLAPPDKFTSQHDCSAYSQKIRKTKFLILKIELLCRRKKEPKMAHNLENPCYVQTCDAAPTNNLGGCEENDYATCHIESNGNVYVEFGDSQPSCQSG